MIELPPMPASIEALPRDSRGYPVPWFVAWLNGEPEFRMADANKLVKAVKQKLCWVCGGRIETREHVFVIGPMCAINKTTAEPPCHDECAQFSVQACPFLSMPAAKRREANLPEGGCAGEMIRRNPGVSLLWYCRGYELFSDGRGGVLFRLPNPSQVRWWSEGRKATREEIMRSIETGLPILEQMATTDGPGALKELKLATDRALKLVPAE